jgi:uncharacterized protein (TIGR02145 family)
VIDKTSLPLINPYVFLNVCCYVTVMRSVINCLIILSVVLIACEKEQNSPPLADIVVFPKIADTSSYIRFDGSSSHDLETSVELLQFRWDFNGDGVWETEYRRDPVAIWQYEKTGTYEAICEARDEGGLTSKDSLQVIIRLNFVRSSFTDPRDGTSYKTVLIDGTLWMAENLRYGVVINSDSIPSDNAITEIFKLDSSEMGNNYIGGYYTWGELTNYQRDVADGICPPGWRVITRKDYWAISRFWREGDVEFYLQSGGFVGLDLERGGSFSLIDRSYSLVDTTGYLWLSDFVKTNEYPFLNRNILGFTATGSSYVVYYEESKPFGEIWKPEWGADMNFNRLAFNVRCIKKSE